MWFLRLNRDQNKYKKLVVIAKIALIILLVHSIIALMILRDRSRAITLTLNSSRKSTAHVSWSSPVRAYTASAGVATQGVAAHSAPSNNSATTAIATAPVAQPAQKIAAPKQIKAPSVEKKQKTVEEKKTVVKEVTKKEPSKTEKIAPKKEIPPKESASPVDSKAEQKSAREELSELPQATHPSNASAWQEEELFELIGKYWHVPSGSFDDCTVHVKISIDREGILNILEMQRSKALIFDSAVQETLCTITWPQWLYGRELNLTFTS